MALRLYVTMQGVVLTTWVALRHLQVAQEKVRGGAVDGMWVIRSPFLSSLSLRDNLVRAFANSWLTLSTPLSSVS